VPERNPNPEPDPLVTRLTTPEDEHATEDVVALVGFIGPQREGHFRIYADRHLQRWLEIPVDSVKDSIRIDTDDELGGRTIIWVEREVMTAEVFDPAVMEAMTSFFRDGWMSTWPLIPDDRLVAAEILGLLPTWETAEYELGG
jgi:hypothetical protein